MLELQSRNVRRNVIKLEIGSDYRVVNSSLHFLFLLHLYRYYYWSHTDSIRNPIGLFVLIYL